MRAKCLQHGANVAIQISWRSTGQAFMPLTGKEATLPPNICRLTSLKFVRIADQTTTILCANLTRLENYLMQRWSTLVSAQPPDCECPLFVACSCLELSAMKSRVSPILTRRTNSRAFLRGCISAIQFLLPSVLGRLDKELANAVK